MAEALTPRLGIRDYTAGTDTFSRAEYSADLIQKLENLVAIDMQGTLAARPTAGIRGRYYHATDTNLIYRDTGSAWVSVGSRASDALFNASGAAVVPLTANGANAQTANVFEARTNNVLVASIGPAGDVAGNSFTGKFVSLVGTSAGQIVAAIKGAAGQTADIFRVRDNTDTDLLKIGSTGAISGKYFQAGDGSGAIGITALTTPAGMSLFAGAPALEVYGKKGGANSAFTEYLYLHHQAADATVASRRIGLLMQIGEASGDASKSGAVYIESGNANAATPDLVLARGDSPVLRFRSDGTSTMDSSPTINGIATIAPGTNPSLVMGSTRIGTHAGNDMYLRTNTNNAFYFYGGGNHSATPGDAGGGTLLASLTKVSGVGHLFASRIVADSLLQSGPASGNNTQIVGRTIQGLNNGVVNDLTLQPTGGHIRMNNSGNLYANGFSVQGHRLFIQSTQPTADAVGDVWIQI